MIRRDSRMPYRRAQKTNIFGEPRKVQAPLTNPGDRTLQHPCKRLVTLVRNYLHVRAIHNPFIEAHTNFG